MFLIFRCGCGRHLYAPDGSKSRQCPCGRRTILAKAWILARAQDAVDAGEIVRKLQMDGREMTGFRSCS